ncbi:GNAT family N-acetyltransferase [Bacillus sp. BHET2]|uniref:GNAT family N-acetyltransferase n=1 Tax=Bacillus sp. BHET2 TaxID=2583818 RepID=UPI00110EF1DA|nr:GNAT family N-acetyltransferase [Bacillus sp. BHET2]TMU85165.1 GNAT family N-acetyltransferase [Bacillus sp. BHET2]
MLKIMELEETSNFFYESVKVFWEQWGNRENYKFYYDCIFHSCRTEEDLPRFYIALEDGGIVGTYALLRNDLNSRQDLFPWLACLYVDSDYRGRGIGSKLLEHGLQKTQIKGYKNLYLSTDLEGYYEKYGWIHATEAIGLSGDSIKVYQKSSHPNS